MTFSAFETDFHYLSSRQNLHKNYSFFLTGTQLILYIPLSSFTLSFTWQGRS